MANSALIDDLRKQFAANPRRVFARLANEYRKRGELDSAIEICRSQVPLQPSYISGHIVLGQALYDSGQLEEARTTFETALGLDPENLIALRHLGDIALASGDTAGAHSCYRRLLDVDPQNEEVAAELDALAHPAAVESEAATDADLEPVSWGDINPERVQLDGDEFPPADAVEQPTRAAADDIVDDAITFAQPGAAESGVELSGSDELEIVLPDPIEPAEFTVPEEIEELPTGTAEFVDFEELVPTAPESAVLDDSSAILTVVASDPDDTVGSTTLSEVAADESLEPEETRVADIVSRATPPLYPEDPYVAAPSDDAPSAFATETMAELYLQQGFPDRALAIYRDLAERRPDDASLRERIAELEQPAAVEPAPSAGGAREARTAREFFGALAYRRAPSGASHLFMGVGSRVPAEDDEAAAALAGAFAQDNPSADDMIVELNAEERESAELMSAEHESEESVSAESMSTDHASDEMESVEPMSARGAYEENAVVEDGPGERAADWNPILSGHPARAANDALSLDDVFRDDVTSARPRRGGSGVSFDEFFARRESGGSPQMTEQPSTGGAAVKAEVEEHDEGNSVEDAPHDLELFHAWLDGLKR